MLITQIFVIYYVYAYYRNAHMSLSDAFNPGCPLVAFGTSEFRQLQSNLKFGIQCGFRVISTSYEHDNSSTIKASLTSVIEG